MKKVGILYDNISGNTGDVAIGISIKKILTGLNVPFDELIPGNFNPLDYETIIIGGGYLIRESPDFFYDKFRVPGNHITNAIGIHGSPQDLNYLTKYKKITVRSTGDKRKLAYLDESIEVIPCTTMLLEDLPELPFVFNRPCIGIHIFPVFSKEEEEQFIQWIISLPYTVYFLPITHYNKDIHYMRSLKEKIPNAEVLPILKAQEIFTICGKFDFFISSSLHGAIFSYVHNVPFLLFNADEKMQFFMEDRHLDHYLFGNFYELRTRFADLERERPDYSENVLNDKKVLDGYLRYLSSVLPVNTAKSTEPAVPVSEATYQISQLIMDNSELERQNFHYRNRISDLSFHTGNLENIITGREHQITELQQHITNLETVLADQKHRITELEDRLHHLDTAISGSKMQIDQLRQHARNLEIVVTNRDNHISQLKKHTRNLETAVADKKQQIQKFIAINQTLSKENTAIKQSIMYTLSTKFNNTVIERLLPPGTRRRNCYHLGLSAFRILMKDGLSHLIVCYHKRKEKKFSYSDTIIPVERRETILQEINSPPTVQTKVSVIIPTKNAGDDFRLLLEKIIHQRGIKTIEIIVVDSGSTDHTRDIAEKAGCRILRIRPEEFNHGLTRNYGAKHAGGDLLVFLVQDAIPIGEFWLYNMVKMLERDTTIAAVTCRQVPRSDADLFACFILWFHNISLKRTNDTIYSCDTGFDQMTPEDKRISAGIEDTCCMMRKRIFDQFRFKSVQYGEDLDLGIRLLKTGYKTAFIHSSGVIHSHNRDPCYFYRRSFIDSLALDSLLNASKKPAGNTASLKETMEQILGLYFLIQKSSIHSRNLPASWSQSIDQCRKVLQSSEISQEKSIIFPWSGGFERTDSGNSLETLIQECARLANAEFYRLDDALIRAYCNLLDFFAEYCKVYPSLENRDQEVSESFNKLFSLVAGSYLAAYFCHKPHAGLSEPEVILMKKLGEGI